MSPGEYRCKLLVRFLSDEGNGEAWTWIDLPFVPTRGLVIGGTTHIKDPRRGLEHIGLVEAEHVVWIHDDAGGYFVIFCGRDDYRGMHTGKPVEDLALSRLGDGWNFEPDGVSAEGGIHVAG